MLTWLFVCLALWGIYRRILRLIGTQVVKQGRVLFRLVILSFGMMVIVLPRLSYRGTIVFVLIGTLIGGGMVYFMVRYTKFWMEESNVVYKSNPYLGCTILILVLSRFVYKIPVLLSITDWLSHTEERPPDLSIVNHVLDPISIVWIMMLLVYFLGSNIYILAAARRIRHDHLDRVIRQKLYASDSSSLE